MDYYEKTRYEFTAFIQKVIKNSATDYKRKLLKSLENEMSVADFASLPNELLSGDNGSFFMVENGDTCSNIENLLTDEKYYRAMKRLSDNEKMVLYLMFIEEKKPDEIAEIMNTTKANVWQIKSRAKRNFLNLLANEI